MFGVHTTSCPEVPNSWAEKHARGRAAFARRCIPMNNPHVYVETFFCSTEAADSQRAREHYNFKMAETAKLNDSSTTGFDKLAVNMDMMRQSRAPVFAAMSGHNRVQMATLLMPTIAGVAEITYGSLMGTQRSGQLWDLCRKALIEGTFADMAKEMGVQRRIRTYADAIFLPLLQLFREKEKFRLSQLSPPAAALAAAPPQPAAAPTVPAAAPAAGGGASPLPPTAPSPPLAAADAPSAARVPPTPSPAAAAAPSAAFAATPSAASLATTSAAAPAPATALSLPTAQTPPSLDSNRDSEGGAKKPSSQTSSRSQSSFRNFRRSMGSSGPPPDKKQTAPARKSVGGALRRSMGSVASETSSDTLPPLPPLTPVADGPTVHTQDELTA